MPTTNSTPDPIAMQFASQARDDLAGRLGISADQISTSSTQAVSWPDSSLGCPQPGMFYSQVVTPGYLILLKAHDKIYEYHASMHTDPFLCENPSPPILGTPSS